MGEWWISLFARVLKINVHRTRPVGTSERAAAFDRVIEAGSNRSQHSSLMRAHWAH